MFKKVIIFIKIISVLLPIGVLLFGIDYYKSIKFYGDFTVNVYNSELSKITQDFDFMGISYFGDTIDLQVDHNEFRNDPEVYFVKLVLQNTYSNNGIIAEIYNCEEDIKQREKLEQGINNVFQSYKTTGIVKKIKYVKLLQWILICFSILTILSVLINIYTKKIILNIKKNRKAICVGLTLILLLLLALSFCFILRQNRMDVHTNYPAFNNEFKIEYAVNNNSDGFLIQIQDTADEGLRFVFNINDNFGFCEKTLIRNVKSMKVDPTVKGTPKEILQAFEFVSTKTYHRCPHEKFQKYHVLNQPGILLNSVGYGLCGNRANLLSIIINELGFKSRIIEVAGHTFIEVYNNNKWIMLDPDYGLCLLDSSRVIASLNEIKSEPPPKSRRVCFGKLDL